MKSQRYRYLRRLMPFRKLLLGLSRQKMLYGIGAIMLGIALFFLILQSLNLASRSVLFTFFILGYTFFILGFSLEAILFFKRIWSTTKGKYFLGVLVLFVTNTSVILARQEINYLVGLNPSFFPIATGVISSILVTLVWIYMVWFIFGLFFIINLLAIPLLTVYEIFQIRQIVSIVRNSVLYRFLFRKRRLEFPSVSIWIFSARYIGSACGFFFILFTLYKCWQFEDLFHEKAKTILLYSEYFGKSHCSNLGLREYAAFIGDGRISIATIDGNGNITFQVKECRSDKQIE
jgi:hypothetical protein